MRYYTLVLQDGAVRMLGRMLQNALFIIKACLPLEGPSILRDVGAFPSRYEWEEPCARTLRRTGEHMNIAGVMMIMDNIPMHTIHRSAIPRPHRSCRSMWYGELDRCRYLHQRCGRWRLTQGQSVAEYIRRTSEPWALHCSR